MKKWPENPILTGFFEALQDDFYATILRLKGQLYGLEKVYTISLQDGPGSFVKNFILAFWASL
jgi:hypothetical protein